MVMKAEGPLLWAGLSLVRPLVMGIVNVTPDSFSDGGRFLDRATAIAHGRKLLKDGADILDIGGESTRPGAALVSPAEQMDRVLPVVESLTSEGAAVSVDTRSAAVMTAAIGAGARIVNDVSALEDDPASPAAVAASGAAVVLMHKRGDPATMQLDTRYDDVVAEVRAYLAARIDAAVAAGIPRERIAIDPGIGFGKTAEGNLRLLRELGALAGLGHPVMVGASRKSFIGRLVRAPDAADRTAGSIAAALGAVQRGAHIVRVHDVAETVQALAVWRALQPG
jgi:dihydropteroate synthase